jgi:uncharacterized RDD family membrane protein YckC
MFTNDILLTGFLDIISLTANVTTALLYSQRRALHDYIAGTVVIKLTHKDTE